MNETMPIAAAPSPAEAVSKAEILLAAEIIQVMGKCAKGSKLYQANNPLLARFFQELTEKVGVMLDRYHEYKIDVERFELKYKGQQIYENTDTNESLAFRIYSDGIRAIIFSPGISEEEIRAFLEIVGMSSSGSLDDDMVTRLWDQELPHCSYLLEDDFQEMEQAGDRQGSGANVGELPLAWLIDPFAVSAPLLPLAPETYSLSNGERGALQALLTADEEFRPTEETARILSVLLAELSDPQLSAAFLEIYLKFTKNLLLVGEREFSLKMFSFLCRLTTAKEPSMEKRQMVLRALATFWSAEGLKGLSRIIDTAEALSVEEMNNLSLLIGQTAPAALCELLGLVETLKMRKILIETTTEMTRRQPRILLPYFNDSRWYLVRNVIFILTKLKEPALLDQVLLLVTHREARVRKEVLKYLIAIDEPRAKPYLLKFLRDESPAMRIMALQMIGRARQDFALKPILAFVASPEYEKMGIAEKKAAYEAIGLLGGEGMLPLFKSLLVKKHLFHKARETEAVLCATAGLQKIGGEESCKLLDAALRSKGQEFREILKYGIAMIQQQKSTPDVRPEED